MCTHFSALRRDLDKDHIEHDGRFLRVLQNTGQIFDNKVDECCLDLLSQMSFGYQKKTRKTKRVRNSSSALMRGIGQSLWNINNIYLSKCTSFYTRPSPSNLFFFLMPPKRPLRIRQIDILARHRLRLLRPFIPRRRPTMLQDIRRFRIQTEAIITAGLSWAANADCIPRATSHASPLLLWEAAGGATGDLCAGVAVAGAFGAVVVVVADAVADEGAEVVGGAGVGDGAGGKVV